MSFEISLNKEDTISFAFDTTIFSRHLMPHITKEYYEHDTTIYFCFLHSMICYKKANSNYYLNEVLK